MFLCALWSAGKRQSTQAREILCIDSLGRQQYMKTFSHPRGRDQMLELERNLRALLWQTAFFEGVGELICLADSHQKL